MKISVFWSRIYLVSSQNIKKTPFDKNPDVKAGLRAKGENNINSVKRPSAGPKIYMVSNFDKQYMIPASTHKKGKLPPIFLSPIFLFDSRLFCHFQILSQLQDKCRPQPGGHFDYDRSNCKQMICHPNS